MKKNIRKNRVNCYKCVHYFVTWDDKFPRGCRAMSFKTKQMPSTVVFRASGEECLRFGSKK